MLFFLYFKEILAKNKRLPSFFVTVDENAELSDAIELLIAKAAVSVELCVCTCVNMYIQLSKRLKHLSETCFFLQEKAYLYDNLNIFCNVSVFQF